MSGPFTDRLVTDQILERYIALMESYGIPREFWAVEATDSGKSASSG